MFKILLNSRIRLFDAAFVYDINFPFVAIMLTTIPNIMQAQHFNVQGVFLRGLVFLAKLDHEG